MPISDPRDRFFYPHHTPMKDTCYPTWTLMMDCYSLAHGLGQLKRDVKSDVRTLNFRNDVIDALPRSSEKVVMRRNNVKNKTISEC